MQGTTAQQAVLDSLILRSPVLAGVIFLYYDCPVTAPFKNILQRSTEENLKKSRQKDG